MLKISNRDLSVEIDRESGDSEKTILECNLDTETYTEGRNV